MAELLDGLFARCRLSDLETGASQGAHAHGADGDVIFCEQ